MHAFFQSPYQSSHQSDHPISSHFSNDWQNDWVRAWRLLRISLCSCIYRTLAAYRWMRLAESSSSMCRSSPLSNLSPENWVQSTLHLHLLPFCCPCFCARVVTSQKFSELVRIELKNREMRSDVCCVQYTSYDGWIQLGDIRCVSWIPVRSTTTYEYSCRSQSTVPVLYCI